MIQPYLDRFSRLSSVRRNAYVCTWAGAAVVSADAKSLLAEPLTKLSKSMKHGKFNLGYRAFAQASQQALDVAAQARRLQDAEDDGAEECELSATYHQARKTEQAALAVHAALRFAMFGYYSSVNELLTMLVSVDMDKFCALSPT